MTEGKLQNLLDAYQGNFYPGMVTYLSKQLNVSEDSLIRLGVGFAPVVQFKKGPNYQGWWTSPERDDDAKLIGLSLRSMDGAVKVMMSGTHHGLIYEVNPEHQAGEKGYSSGAHNWIRTTDAGVLCPVCEKPDGCLCSAENPSDPKAVVCIRTESAKKLRFGFLHILKPEGQLTGRTALSDNGGPVIIVEGMSDTATGLDLRFNTVGRPSNLACMDLLCDLVRGRDCVVIGENDLKPDGKFPGREGMIAAYQSLRRACPSVKMIMPPGEYKDLRAWKQKGDLDHDKLLAYIEEHHEGLAGEIAEMVMEDGRPTTIARAYLGQKHRMAGRYTLRNWMQGWYEYHDGKYYALKPDEATQPLYIWGYDRTVRTTNQKTGEITMVPLKIDPYTSISLQQAMMAETLISETALPAWINGTTGPAAKDLIVFSNGILTVPAYLAGRPEAEYWQDQTPDLFTLAAVSTPFDPTAKCPVWMEQYLAPTLGDEPDKILLMQEWYGYCLTCDTSMQKMMFFRGRPGSGKGTAIRVLHQLVGAGQAAATDFTTLSGDFGMQSLLGKLILTIADARTPKHGREIRGLEILLNITGNDEVSINRKFKDYISDQRLTTRITIAANSFLEVTDHEGALARRLLLIQFENDFVGREDTELDDKLAAEIPGIINWALEGLARVRRNGKFTIPASSVEALAEIKIELSPIASFLEECCKREGETGKHELFDAYAKWTVERRISAMSKSRFFERLRTNAPEIRSDTYMEGIHKRSVYKGVSLHGWAARQLLGKPN